MRLDFDRAQVGQETGYWCGPATVQNALKVRGISVSESDIARQTEELEGNVGWDDRDGTDYIGQLATVLNRYVDAEYTVVDIRNDPPTRDQVEKFWSDLSVAIDAGYGVPMNWISPPGNHPRGQLNSLSPGYYGTIFHYVLADGYAVQDGLRYVHITDSGFQPSEYWISLAQCVSLIAGKGYAPIKAAPDFDAKPMIDDIRELFAPMVSDVKDIRHQVVYRWPHVANTDLKGGIAKLS